MTRRKRGFTLLEMIIATLYLMTCLVYLFTFFSSFGKSSLDSYHETMAYLLAKEGIELVTCMGYEELIKVYRNENIGSLPVNFTNFLTEPVPSEPWRDDQNRPIVYPNDYLAFNRQIIFDLVDETVGLIRVTVRVSLPQGIMRRGEVVLTKLVGKDNG